MLKKERLNFAMDDIQSSVDFDYDIGFVSSQLYSFSVQFSFKTKVMNIFSKVPVISITNINGT